MAQSGPEKKKEPKNTAKSEISSLSPLEDLIHVYLEEGKLIAANYINNYLYEPRKNEYSIIESWQKKLEEKTKSWPTDIEVFKKAKLDEFKKMLREQTLLGEIYLSKNYYALAVRCYQRAADHEEPISVLKLGWLYGRGYGVPVNVAMAVTLCQKAAMLGAPIAQRFCGMLCETGYRDAIPKNDVEAARWYRLSAEQGDTMAQVSLAQMYEMGRGGLQKDLGKAASLYSRVKLQAKRASKSFKIARDRLFELFYTNPDHLLISFYYSISASDMFSFILAGSPKRMAINRLNTLLIKKVELAEEKKDAAAIQQLHEFYQEVFNVQHKIMLSLLIDKRNVERWEQYVLKQKLLEKRVPSVIGIHILGFLGDITPKQSVAIKVAAAKHSRMPEARQKVELIKAVLNGEAGAEAKLYNALEIETGKSEIKPTKLGKQKIKNYAMLEKLIKDEGKKSARTPIDLAVALGILYYVAGDHSKAADQFLKAMRAEDPRGYFYIGKMYEQGHHFKKSEPAAKQCYAKADELAEKMQAKAKHDKPGSRQ